MTSGTLPHQSSAFSSYSPPERAGPTEGVAHLPSEPKLLPNLTVSLVKTYQGCSSGARHRHMAALPSTHTLVAAADDQVNALSCYPSHVAAFRYSSKLAPRRVLTKPAEPAGNSGWDNATHDLIVAVGDEFVSTLGTRYVVRDLLGQGTFGQVFKCVCADDADGEESSAIAIKVVKNQAAYYHQARVEIGVLQFLNTRADPGDRHHIVRLQDFFLFRNHLCLAFELLSLNLYELIRHNKFCGLSLSLVRVFVNQMLDALVVLRDSRIIHCDLKPENVLLKNVESGEIKIIDFGSACFESRTVYSYIQSRFYRSPEVVLGYPYAMSIDMWSLGCVAAELFLGLPLFPGACEHDLLSRIVSTLGPLPDFLLTSGKNARKFFSVQEEVVADPGTGEQLLRQRFLLRTRQQFEELTGQPAPAGKQYFKHSALGDIIGAYPLRAGLSDEEVARERLLRQCFTDFLLGVLDVNPATRWTPRQAAQHPFITGERFTGPFQPPPDLSSSPAVATPLAVGGSRPGSGASLQQQQRRGVQQQQMHTPGMAIPLASAGARQQQAATLAASAEQAAAAAAAASPWAAATAHAAAMAAVQARYGSHPQQQYNVAHSLQNIMAVPQMAGSFGVAGMQGTPTQGGSFAPLLSPPSRSFHTQLRYADFSSSLLQQQQMASMDNMHGVMPLLQTPTSAGPQQLPFSPGSFQPSSQQLLRSGLAAAGDAAAGGSRWTSMDGSSPGGTPPLAAMPSAEDVPNPADFDPLWSDALLEEEEEQQQGQPDQAPHAKRQHMQAPEPAPARPPQAQTMHRREPSLSHHLPTAGQQQQQPQWHANLQQQQQQRQQQERQQRQASLQQQQQLQRQASLQQQEQELQQLQRQASLQQQRSLQQQSSLQQQLEAAASLGASLGGSADPLALAAKCLPQLQQLQEQQQAAAAQQAYQRQQLTQQQAAQQAAQQQPASGASAMLGNASGSAFAFHSPFSAQQAQLQAAQQQAEQQHAEQQRRQAEVASMLSAFGRAAAAAVADPGAVSSTPGSEDVQQAAVQQQQLLLLHQALSIGAQHSTTLTDGFANYTLQEAASTGAAPAVAAAVASAAAAFAQQHPRQVNLGEQQAAAQPPDWQTFTPTAKPVQQYGSGLAGAADSVASMLWSPAVAPQLLQAAVESQPPPTLMLGAQLHAQQSAATAAAATQQQQAQQQQQHVQHHPLQQQHGFNL
ncbi:hypothetical protein COHA_003568 [Chlorella ohadii]|uniref:Protein kinase domain-containing protein n=1 Tax=Chlorella ohadii TaxID=2649997 RepID=A0AAD5DRB1_9CHLO|nr:hypothetical protein COHA_003568 [Chlorella ohadii]